MSDLTTETICVAGASGLAGSHIVKQALAQGYRVHGTLRHLGQLEKVSALMALPGAKERLHLFSANAKDSQSFDQPLSGVKSVFITCFPTVKQGLDGTPAGQLDIGRGMNEIIRPAEQGCLNILRAALRQGTDTALLCSSTASAEPLVSSPLKQEQTDISDPVQQVRSKKYMQAQKTIMERASVTFAAKNGLRLCTMLPSMMVGPGLLPGHLDGHVLRFLAGLTSGQPGWHQQVPAGSMSVTCPADLAKAFLAASVNPSAEGRYFAVSGSWSWQQIYQQISQHVPAKNLPKPLTAMAESPTGFDFSRRDSLGVPFKSLEDLIAGFYGWLKEVKAQESQLSQVS